MKFAVLSLFIATAALSWPQGALTQRVEANVDAMGSTYSIVAYGEDEARLRAAVEDASDEAKRLDQLLSNYIPSSEWSQVNREAADHPVRISTELFQLLAACVEYSRESDGAFDITVGPLMKVWGFYKGSGHLPHRAEIRGAMDHIGYQNMILDPAAHTVRFAKPGIEMDPGGIGKGYAVDKMVEVLKQDGVKSALVSASGSSIYGLGAPPNEPGWKIKIRNPKDASQTAAEVVLHDMSLSTSGNYEKFFFAEGKLYSHIMDPRTGYPSEGMLQVSVVSPKTIDSEAWCKPYYIRGRAWAAQHKNPEFKVLLCEDRNSGSNQCAWLQ
jgi:FAD:protein FMN transferase